VSVEPSVVERVPELVVKTSAPDGTETNEAAESTTPTQ